LLSKESELATQQPTEAIPSTGGRGRRIRLILSINLRKLNHIALILYLSGILLSEEKIK